MTQQRRKILFFTPYATRTGSEVLIYYILKYLDRSRFEAGLVCFAQGELLNDLPADIPVFYVRRDFTFSDKVAFHLGFHPIERALKKISKEFKADLWYINTVMLPDVIQTSKKLNIPVISHVHELSATFSQIKSDDFQTIVNDSDLIIGCSDTVCKVMQESGSKRIERLYSFVDLNEITPDKLKVQEIRKEWGAGPDDFVWIMSGTSSERKGFDLLPEIALQIPKDARIHLVWVGKLSDDGLVYWTTQRCKQINHVKIHLIGAKKENYYSYIDAADGFMMTSRQEPFGMVLVEAAWLGKPIVTFDSGGPAEFVTPEIGTVISDLNISMFVESMLEWSEKKVGYSIENARKKAMEFSVEKKVIEWQEIIDRFQVFL